MVAQETAVAQARLLLPPLERQLAQQRNLLATLTGRFASEGLPAAFELQSFRLPRKLPLSLPADLVRQRPDVRVAEANLHAANAQIGVAIANRLPQITLTGNAGSTADSMARLFAPGTLFWTIAGNAAQTVFDAGSRYYKQKAAEEATAQAAAQYRCDGAGRIPERRRRAARACRPTNARSAPRSRPSSPRSRNIDLVRRQVEQGQVSRARCCSTRSRPTCKPRSRACRREAARLADTVALFQALGGGWWNRPDCAARLTLQ